MPKTKISDVIVPSIFNNYVIQRTMQISALFQSGIVAPVAELAGKLTEGGRLINMPYWNDLTGNDENLSDSVALTPEKITTGQDVATQLFRGKAWSTNDLAATLSGADPMAAIGNLVSGYWDRRQQDALISVLKGVFTGPLAATHVNDISIADGNNATAANKISGGAAVNTISKLGDAYDALTAVVMHSVVYFELVRQDLITFVKNSDGTLDIPHYLGKRVIVDDSMLKVAGATSGFKYYTVFFGPGAIGYAEGSPEVPTETDRDILAGDDILVNRRHYILHPRGVKFTNTTVTDTISPSNADLALTTNWAKVYEDKAIRMVALVSNG